MGCGFSILLLQHLLVDHHGNQAKLRTADNLHHVRVTDLGVKKGPSPETPDAQSLTAVVSTAAQRLLRAE